ncbi:MAG TPA: glycoside hydrolase family 2 TIM barrel-domain containing protein, partial [Candidatus Limnocylindrales bacterium]|nr:glycoside hydrolase family 2 TIM barrel-domain containing protein [Candidatus Limnocylindrales bacterium]
RSLDGDDWRIRPHLGLEAALAAARAAVAAPDIPSDQARATEIHAVHTAADAVAGWFPARVPGSVVDDLLRAGEVPDPYVERNSRLVEWVATRAWTYRRTIDAPRLAPGERAWLRFDGIDAAGHVVLDGRSVADHEGMFVPLELEITEQLGRDGGRHELAVVVEPAPDDEPQVGRTSRVRVHKSRMGYGWDFCPRLIHQGLWQSVSLTTAGPVRIRDVWARPTVAPDLARATILVEVTVDAALSAVAPDGPSPRPLSVVASLTGTGGPGTVLAEATAPAPASGGTVTLELAVDGPDLWWPNGHGPQPLHDVRVALVDDGVAVDERHVRVGFRRIERRENAGAPAGAEPWTFVVNGRPIELLGWNWTPVDTLYGVPQPDRLGHLLRLAAASGAAILRVWGGGLIETEAFYDACDRLGLLVWQEFSQSSSGLDNAPSEDPAFVERMRSEAEAIVPLRRNHPSLAIWCGGNELQAADGRPLDDAGSPVLAALHDVVARLDPDRVWLPSSPSGPRFHNRLAEIEADPDGLHDVHGPWEHQGLAEQHRLWDAGTSLLNSEFGVEGMTNRRTHERLIAPEHRWPADRSNPIDRHLGDWWINEPLVQASFGGRLTDLGSLRRASQWLQAEGLRYGVEANRRRWPRNTGSLPWQLNESFPNAWCTAVVDHRGEPKPAYHAVRRAFGPTLVCARFASPALRGAARFEADVYAWSGEGGREEPAPLSAAGAWTAAARLIRVDGAVVAEEVWPVAIVGREPIVAARFSVELPDEGRRELLLFDLALRDGAGRQRSTNRYVIARGDDLSGLLDLPAARLDVAVEAAGDRWRLDVAHRDGPAAVGIVVHDDRPIEVPGWPELDDNALDLLPGETRTIEVRWMDAPRDGRRLLVTGWNVGPIEVVAP